MRTHFDIIIAGSGGAGLSLAYYLHREGALADKTLLMLDRSHSKTNDRTWSFWYKGQPPFKSIIHKTYEQTLFSSTSFQSVLNILPYRYHVLRGIDFYTHVHEILRTNEKIHWHETEIDGIGESNGRAVVRTANGAFTSTFCFNSLYTPEGGDTGRYIFLRQHFSGRVIKTENPVFDPRTFTIHDFTVPQNGLHRFMYVLPFSATEALVEYTLFSPELLPRREYEEALDSYIREKLRIEKYTTIENEFGVIPMTDQPFSTGAGPVYNIGTLAGAAKGSTGYAFARIQRHTEHIARSLHMGKMPSLKPLSPVTFRIMDSVMLRVLSENGDRGQHIFSAMFKNNPPGRIFSFLDEESSWWEILKIINSVPYKSSFTRHSLTAMMRIFAETH